MWKNQGSEQLSNFPTFTQPQKGEARKGEKGQ